ncbi:hypothetical protein RD792_014770 [Penstemon davidsonii]|uniref:RRM domain-containing protein n=1 Tax=Penstemon davidsonii TaxID=160366 RepID=A0ABR0CQC8_9LAMI|nr:hypothetical protein RD792_014770 [Penstemon davidsonii]
MATAALNHRILPLRSPASAREAKRQYPLVLSIPKGLSYGAQKCNLHIPQSLSSSSSSSTPRIPSNPSTKLFVSGLSFRTTEESLRNAFKNFGELVQVNLVMDKIAKRPRGFAFITYATEDESKRAIEGMHGKFLDGRVIFVEIAKSRSELRQGSMENLT